MVPRAGLGATPSGSKLKNSPRWATRSSRQQAFMTRIASSLQAPRRACGTPKSSISSFIQPTPAPSTTRPGAR